MFQQIQIVGNLGADPEIRYTPSNVAVTTLSVATNKSWTNGNGEQQEKVTWFRVTVWRKAAEAAAKYLTKGSPVLVIGEMEDAEPWTGDDGTVRASLNVTAQTVKFLPDGRREGGAQRTASAPERAEPVEPIAVEELSPW